MDINEAKELLSYHSCRNENFKNQKWQYGFLGSLRPLSGLNEENFREVIECMRTLHEELKADQIDRNLLADIVNIVHLARAWSSKGGMLERNHLLTAQEIHQLTVWTDVIEECLCFLLDEAEEEAFLAYDDYYCNGYWMEDEGDKTQ